MDTLRGSMSSSEDDLCLKSSQEAVTVLKRHSGLLLLRYWIHFAAIGITALLAYINLMSLYFTDSDDPQIALKLNILQFAAKAHEILLTASLMLIVMDCVRGRLVTSTGVPLGYVLSPVLFNDLDWLLRPEFWHCVRSTKFLSLTLLLLTAIPFVNVAGPLSAILIIPRLGWSPATAAGVYPVFWNASADDIWPSTLTNDSLPERCSEKWSFDGSQCPAQALRVVEQIEMSPGSFDCTVQGVHISCNQSVNSNRVTEYDSTSTTVVVSDFSQPIIDGLTATLNPAVARFRNISGTQTVVALKNQLVTAQFEGTQSLKKGTVRTNCEQLAYGEVYDIVKPRNMKVLWPIPEARWIDDLSSNTTSVLLMTYSRDDSFFVMNESCSGQNCYMGLLCTVEAWWTPVDVWWSTAQNLLYQNNLQPSRTLAETKRSEMVPIKMDQAYLEHFGSTGMSIGGMLQEGLNKLNVPMSGTPEIRIDQSTTQQPLQVTNFTQAVSIILSGAVSSALRDLAYKVGFSSYTGDCSDVGQGFSFAAGVCERNASAWIHDTGISSVQDRTSMAKFMVKRYGYGWFRETITVDIALGILLAHALFTTIYLLKVLLLRRTITTRWTYASELLVLAVDSIRAPALMGSSAKVTNKKLWRETVTIREVESGDRLSFVVGDPLHYGGLIRDPPKLGKKYA